MSAIIAVESVVFSASGLGSAVGFGVGVAAGAGLNRAPSGFLAPRDMFLGNVKSNVDGIFYAGTITAPKNIGESLNEGIAAADAAAKYVEA